MITQKLLDDVKSHEEYFFSFLGVPVDAQPIKKDGAGGKTKGDVVETPLRPDQVDKIVKRALNRLKVKQDLVKKRSSNLTAAEAARATKEAAEKGKKKKRKGSETEGEGAAAVVVVKSKKKRVDKKDKKERRKVDLKGRSAKKDAKNKAVKSAVETVDAPENAEVSAADESGAETKEQFIFGKIATAGADGKKKQMGKDFKKHLKNLQETRGKIAQAKGEDPEKGEALEEKFAWKNVMEKAQGVKVKDDEGLIKKSIKRKENIKKQSQKKWEKREKEVKEKMAAKQEKRTTNIRAKKDEKIKKKVKKMTKKGRLVPGLNAPDV